jgi:hypothetical protein
VRRTNSIADNRTPSQWHLDGLLINGLEVRVLPGSPLSCGLSLSLNKSKILSVWGLLWGLSLPHIENPSLGTTSVKITTCRPTFSIKGERGVTQGCPIIAEQTSIADLGRHQRNCNVCKHRRRDEIEREFINWTGAAAIAKTFALKDRASGYRHAHATGLFPKRQRNLRAALERIIERAGEVTVTASAVVAAVQACAKINSQGEWVEPVERVSFSDLFDRMTREELAAYAKDGTLPTWFAKAVSATPVHRQPRIIGGIACKRS